MRLFHSEMLQSHAPLSAGSYRGPVYGSRYDRRARRTRVPALPDESAPGPTPEGAVALAQAPREILFRLAKLDCAA